jgi:virulence factor Mce-like protein
MTASRSRRAVARKPSRVRLVALGLGGIAVLAGLLVFGINSPNGIPGRSYYVLDVAFDDADNISIHSQIRMGGRLVGQVLAPRVEHGQAVVTLQLTPDVAPLRSDTHVKVKPRSAIGTRFVEILPGSRGAPLRGGARIPASQTGSTRPLDEALSTFDAPTRKRAQVLLRELGGAVAGRGEGLNDTVAAGAPFLSGLSAVTAAIADRRGAAGRLVRGADTMSGALAPVSEDLAAGLRPEAAVARAFAGERDALHATLEAAPPALRSLSAQLPRTRPLLVEVSRFARRALPALEAAPPALRDAAALLDETGPTLHATRETLVQARAAIPPTLGLLRTVRPELDPLEAAIGSATPILRNLGPRYCDMRNMLGGWAGMMQYGNAAGNYLRFNVEAAAESVQGWNGLDIGKLAAVGNAYPAPCEAGTEDIGGRP